LWIFAHLSCFWFAQRRQREVIVLGLKDGAHELWHVEVHLENGVEVTGVANILEADGDVVFSLSLLWVQRFLRYRVV